MNILCNFALLESNQRYPVTLYPNGVDLEAFQRLKAIKGNIEELTNKGFNLCIYSGNEGNGKSSWAIKILLAYLNAVRPTSDLTCRGLMVYTPKLVSSMKDNITERNEYFNYVKDNIIKADLVVWDDIAFKEVTSFEHEFFMNAIDQRLATNKANVYTATGSMSVIKNRLGPRLSSRIISNSEIIQLNQKDRREARKW